MSLSEIRRAIKQSGLIIPTGNIDINAEEEETCSWSCQETCVGGCKDGCMGGCLTSSKNEQPDEPDGHGTR